MAGEDNDPAVTTVERRIDLKAERLLASEIGQLFRLVGGQSPQASEDEREHARSMIRAAMRNPATDAMTRLVIARATEITIGLPQRHRA